MSTEIGIQAILRGIRSILSLVYMAAAVVYIGTLLVAVSPPLYKFSKDLNKKFTTKVQEWFIAMLIFCSMVSAPFDFILTGNKSVFVDEDNKDTDPNSVNIFSESESAIIMANHQVYTDWIYVWAVSKLQGLDGRVKVFSKHSVKKIPFIGWGMIVLEFIFLKRDWVQDQLTIKRYMQKVKEEGHPLLLLLFPEGTTFVKDRQVKSTAIAIKENLPVPKHLLVPRSKGLWFMLQNSRGIVKYVYDFTIAYSGVKEHEYAEQVYSLKDIYLMGKYPHQIHIHIRKFAVEDIPEDEGDFTSWIRDRFYEKDEILDHFYKNGKLVDNEKDPELHSCINPFKLSTLARELVFLNLTGVIFFYLLKKVVLLIFRCLFTLF